MNSVLVLYSFEDGCSSVIVVPADIEDQIRALNIYYCMTGRAIWENIQLDGGSIGPTEGRDNTEPES